MALVAAELRVGYARQTGVPAAPKTVYVVALTPSAATDGKSLTLATSLVFLRCPGGWR